ncbi:hypothetical protein [Streptomyces sp. NPDC092370]|uniref:hypothetical protein n=1 Tax=Streptomyces sp. NPDC092370 TaxID=3366016 RepID=UPI003827BA71
MADAASPGPSPYADRTPVIDVTALREAYAGRPAVDDVSFAVEEGEIFREPRLAVLPGEVVDR